MMFNTPKIILKHINKEFSKQKVADLSYNNLEEILIKQLKSKNITELNEQRYDAEMIIQHIELHNFDNFVGTIRLSYYAIILAILALIFSSQDMLIEFLNSYNITFKMLIGSICSFMSFVVISHNITSFNQKENLVYYRFKLKSLEKILNDKSKKR